LQNKKKNTQVVVVVSGGCGDWEMSMREKTLTTQLKPKARDAEKKRQKQGAKTQGK